MKHYARLTIDMTPEEHTYLKMASAQLGISMRKFMLLSAFQMMKNLEDEWLSKKAEEAIEKIASPSDKNQLPGEETAVTPRERDMSLT
ncbi:MAG TPA: hypothetical protein DCE71_04530 [Parachlamydiales bacterium]|nr:hypothetical protein [Parachlamydiales bacterium]